MSAPLGDWLDAADRAFREIAETALGFETTEFLSRKNSMPRDLPGAYVPLFTDGSSLQVGIAGSLESCREIARALLCMEPDEELTHGDMADALGEIANIAAGVLKGHMAAQYQSITLGLPIFFNGAIEPTDRLEFAVSDMKLGGFEVSAVVVQHKQGA